MFVLGLILVLLAALLIAAAVLGGADDAASYDLGSLELSGLSVAVVFLGGALTLLVLVIGLALLRVAARRSRSRRRESKELNKVSAKLEQREAELREERATHPTTSGDPGTGSRSGDTVADPNRDSTTEPGSRGTHPQDPPPRSS